jgi:hypothetical protein
MAATTTTSTHDEHLDDDDANGANDGDDSGNTIGAGGRDSGDGIVSGASHWHFSNADESP